MEKVLVVRTVAQAALFEFELKGQLSDGAWENTRPDNHWRPWNDAKVVVAEPGQPTGRNFYAVKTSYNFNRPDLVGVVWGRMLFLARIARTLGMEVARRVHDVHLIELDDEGYARLDWEPTGTGDYWDRKRAAIAELDRVAISLACADITEVHDHYTKQDMRRDLRELGAIVKCGLDRYGPVVAAVG